MTKTKKIRKIGKPKRIRDKQKSREYMQKYRDNNREKVREDDRLAYKKNPKKGRAKAIRYRKENPFATREARLKRDYNLTIEAWENLFKSQGSVCAVCSSDVPKAVNWHTDHDHVRNVVRGILCYKCNYGIGLLGDTLESVFKALEYLRKHEEKESLTPEGEERTLVNRHPDHK